MEGRSPVPVGSMPQVMAGVMVLGKPFELEFSEGIFQILLPEFVHSWNE
jgi:hypothetical protein